MSLFVNNAFACSFCFINVSSGLALDVLLLVLVALVFPDCFAYFPSASSFFS